MEENKNDMPEELYDIDFWSYLKKNALIRLTYKHSYRQGCDIETKIVLYKGHVDKFGYTDLGHPMNVSDSYMDAGGMAVYDNDWMYMEAVTKEETDLWIKKYLIFHKQVIDEKGSDFCEEHLGHLKMYTGPKIINSKLRTDE